MIAKEDTIGVEHWDNFEDKVLSEAAGDIMRRDKEVNQTLQKKPASKSVIFFLLIAIAELNLHYKGGWGLSRMNPGHDEHNFHLFKEKEGFDKKSFQVYFASGLNLSSVLCLLGKNRFRPLHQYPVSPVQKIELKGMIDKVKI